MALKVHAVVEDAADLHLAVIADSVQEEVPRMLHAADPPHAGSAVSEMVRSGGHGKLRSGQAATLIGVLCYVEKGASQERLIPETHLFPEMLVRPGQNRLDVALRGRSEDETSHGSGAATEFDGLGRPLSQAGDVRRELLRAADLDSRSLVKLIESFGRQGPQERQFCLLFAGLVLQKAETSPHDLAGVAESSGLNLLLNELVVAVGEIDVASRHCELPSIAEP